MESMNSRHTLFIRLILVVILSQGYLSGAVFSQSNISCAEKLERAQSLFEKGQISQVPSILESCMKSGFTQEESLSAYKLLIQSYLFEDKLELADSAMLAFLKKNPEYQVSPTDHSSFVNLLNTFRVKPVLQISFHIGTNLPFITFIDNKSTASEPGPYTYNTDALNLYTSFEAKLRLSNKIEINVEAGYSQMSVTNTEEFMGFGMITYNENQQRLEMPFSVTYNIKSIGNFTPYGRFGIGPALIMGSTAETEFKPVDINGIPHNGPNLDRKDSRIAIDLFTQLGAGIKLKTRNGFINAEIRSNFGLFNQVIRGGASAEELEIRYYYIDDDFHINALNFSIGYTRIFYKPSRIKE